jgi:tetratricopeptide (TPR) repeat protein
LDTADPTALDRLADALAEHRAGRRAPAEAGYRAALAADPEQPLAWHLLGRLLHEAGRDAEALPALRQALALHPDNAETRLALADATATNAPQDAIALYRAVLAARPGHPAALVNLANALCRTGDAAAAIAACQAALELHPELAAAHVTLGRAWLTAGESHAAEALAAATRAAAIAPGMAEAHFLRGVALAAHGRPQLAAEALLGCLARDPDHARAHLALANALIDQDRNGAAETHLRRAIALEPGLPEAHASLGFLLAAMGRLPEAIAACDAAIAARPGFVRAFWNKSVAQLLAGDFVQGWENYESRKRHDRFARDFSALPGREWQGETLEGHTLLVHAEQGLGDTIQFARYLPLLAARGARVVLACAAPLHGLLAPLAETVPRDARLPPYDAWVDQMSLPRLFATQPHSIPAPCGYLRAEPARSALWHADGTGRPRIGLVWSGNPAHHNDRRRSLPAAELAPLLAVPGIAWVSVQKGPRSGELARHGIADISARLADFADTAGLLATLDLVIAVDTAVAHLAGALGRPCWVMLPHAPDWRWMTGRSDSPWYASHRLFRQDAPGDWRSVTARIGAELAGFAAGYGARANSEVISMPSVPATPVTTMPHTMSTAATEAGNPLMVARLVMS